MFDVPPPFSSGRIYGDVGYVLCLASQAGAIRFSRHRYNSGQRCSICNRDWSMLRPKQRRESPPRLSSHHGVPQARWTVAHHARTSFDTRYGLKTEAFARRHPEINALQSRAIGQSSPVSLICPLKTRGLLHRHSAVNRTTVRPSRNLLRRINNDKNSYAPWPRLIFKPPSIVKLWPVT